VVNAPGVNSTDAMPWALVVALAPESDGPRSGYSSHHHDILYRELDSFSCDRVTEPVDDLRPDDCRGRAGHVTARHRLGQVERRRFVGSLLTNAISRDRVTEALSTAVAVMVTRRSSPADRN